MKRIIFSIFSLFIIACFTACGNSVEISKPENPVEVKFAYSEIKYESFAVPKIKVEDYLSVNQRNSIAEENLKELINEELDFFKDRYPEVSLTANFDKIFVYDVDSEFITNLGGLENTSAAYIPIWDVFLLNIEYDSGDLNRLHDLAHESVHKIFYDSNPNLTLGLEFTLKKGNKRLGSNVIFCEGETEKLALDFLTSNYPEVVSDCNFDGTRSYEYVPYLCNVLSKTTNLDVDYWKNDMEAFSREFNESVYIKTGKITAGTPSELLLYACDQSCYGDYTTSLISAWEMLGISISGTEYEDEYIRNFDKFDREVCGNKLRDSNLRVYLNTLIME